MNELPPKSLQQALAEFVGAFELVFHHDWEYTASMIGGEDPSFLSPGLSLEAETEDWGARGALLEKYRNLIDAMDAAGISPVFPFPIENLSLANRKPPIERPLE
jgi:hypothetical protein